MAKSSNKWLERYTDGGLYIPLEGTSYVVRQQISKPRTYGNGGKYLTVNGEYHRVYENAEGDIMVNHPKEDKGKWDTINLTQKAKAKTIAQGIAATKKWHRENPEYANGGLNNQDPPVESLRSATTYSVTPQSNATYPIIPQNFVPIKWDAKTQKEIELLQKSINERTKNTPEFKQARKLTKEEQDYSDKVKARMKNPSADLGILAANMASAFTRLQYLTPDEIKKITNNPKGTIKVAADILEQGLINELTGGALTALSKAAPQTIKSVGKYLTEGPLKNAYEYNPWAFKPNPEAYYHRSPNLENIINRETKMLQGFGESEAGKAYSKLAQPGAGPNVIKRAGTPNEYVSRINLMKPANSKLYFAKGTPLDYGRTNMILDKRTGKLIPGQGYPGPYIVEVEGVPMGASTKGRAPGAEPTRIGSYAVPRRPISLDEAKFYKEDWLRRYKPVEVPKSTSNSNYPFFKSITGNPEYINTEHLAALIKRETDWLRSPEYVKRKMAATGKSEQAIKEESEKIINNINNTSIEYTGKSEDWAAGLYAPNVSGKNPKISVFNGTVDNAYHDGVLRHEVGHAFSEMGNPSDNLIRFLKNEGYRNYPKVNLNKTIKDKISSIFGNSWANLAPEQQITARRMMDIIEETQGLKRGTYLTEDNVKKLINHLKSDKFNVGDTDVIQVISKFKRKFGEGYSKQLKDFLNKAYVISGIGVVGAEALQQKENGDWLNKYEQGGYADDSAVLNSEGQEVNTMQFALPTVPTFNFGNGNGNGNGDGDGEDPKDKKKSKDKKTDTRTIGQKRHDALEAAKTKILKTESPENKKKMDMLYSTTMAAENTYGYDPKAYGRKKQTRSPMSIDNIALDELFNPKGEKNRYTLQQKSNFNLLRSLGLPTDKAKLKELLETDDAYAGLGVAKTLYYNEGALKNLPNPTDTAAYINLYLDEYNKKGALKYQKRNELIDNITNKMRAQGKRETKTIKPVVKNKTTK